MAKNKGFGIKMTLVKAARQNRRMVPVFVISKTKRKYRFNPLFRPWRSMNIKERTKHHIPEEMVVKRKRKRKNDRKAMKKKRARKR